MEKQDKASDNKPQRNEKGQLLPGNTANPKGRLPDTEADKIKKKATKELIEDYKDKLAEALPKLTPILIDKAADGDLQAIKEVNDRVMGKPHQTSDITTQGLPIVQIAKEILDKHEIDISPERDS